MMVSKWTLLGAAALAGALLGCRETYVEPPAQAEQHTNTTEIVRERDREVVHVPVPGPVQERVVHEPVIIEREVEAQPDPVEQESFNSTRTETTTTVQEPQPSRVQVERTETTTSEEVRGGY